MEYILPSGANLQITVAPFQDAHALLKAILRAVKDLKITGNSMGVDMSVAGLAAAPPEFLSQIIEKILSVATSDDVERCLLRCFERCTYGGIKIQPILFDDPKFTDGLREDYYSICFKVIEANCKPFFVKTFSGLLGSVQTIPASPK